MPLSKHERRQLADIEKALRNQYGDFLPRSKLSFMRPIRARLDVLRHMQQIPLKRKLQKTSELAMVLFIACTLGCIAAIGCFGFVETPDGSSYVPAETIRLYAGTAALVFSVLMLVWSMWLFWPNQRRRPPQLLPASGYGLACDNGPGLPLGAPGPYHACHFCFSMPVMLLNVNQRWREHQLSTMQLWLRLFRHSPKTLEGAVPNNVPPVSLSDLMETTNSMQDPALAGRFAIFGRLHEGEPRGPEREREAGPAKVGIWRRLKRLFLAEESRPGLSGLGLMARQPEPAASVTQDEKDDDDAEREQPAQTAATAPRSVGKTIGYWMIGVAIALGVAIMLYLMVSTGGANSATNTRYDKLPFPVTSSSTAAHGYGN